MLCFLTWGNEALRSRSSATDDRKCQDVPILVQAQATATEIQQRRQGHHTSNCQSTKSLAMLVHYIPSEERNLNDIELAEPSCIIFIHGFYREAGHQCDRSPITGQEIRTGDGEGYIGHRWWAVDH